MIPTWQKRTLLAIAACGFAASAMAQYIWLDDKGVKQFSDTPPPASVPKKRILKEPAGMPVSAAPSSEASGNGDKPANAASAPKAPLTTAERNVEFNKRRAEQAEKDKKDAEAAKLAADKAKNCERARSYQRSLESSQRISQMDKNGQSSYMNDEQRAQELRETKRILADCN